MRKPSVVLCTPWSWVALALAGGAAGFAFGAWADATPPTVAVRMIQVSSKRYEFVPSTLVLKKGETVDLELRTEDVPMGFSVPDLQTRATMVPGQVIHLRLTPDRVGTFPFLCDIFCGSGHEDMNGVVTVVE